MLTCCTRCSGMGAGARMVGGRSVLIRMLSTRSTSGGCSICQKPAKPRSAKEGKTRLLSLAPCR
jgi:hypothetical protein